MIVWTISIIAIIGCIFNVFKNIISYYIWTATNIAFTIYNISIKEYAQAIFFGACLITTILGIIIWSGQKQKLRN